jgi:hypothetical protein
MATTKAIEATIQDVETENPNGEFSLILSTDGTDRDGENLWAAEWAELPAKCHLDSDHAFSKGQSVPFTVGSGVPEITENGDLQVTGSYAGTDHGQLVRQLVKEGHVWQASVAYQEHEDDDGNVTRELLNGSIVGVPSNPEAVITSSKAAKPSGTYADPKNSKYPIDSEEHTRAAWSYINQPKNAAKYSASELAAIRGRIRSAARKFGIDISDKAVLVALAKAIVLANTKVQDLGASSVYDSDSDQDDGEGAEEDADDNAAQAVHDAAVALGASCSSCTDAILKTPTGTVIDGLIDSISTQTLPTTGKTAATAPNGAAAAVTPADLAARAQARARKFQFDHALLEREIF